MNSAVIEDCINLPDGIKLTLVEVLKRYVKVSLSNNCTILGWVQSADPISSSLLLLNFKYDNSVQKISDVVLVPGYNIKNLEVLDDELTPEIEYVLDTIFKKREVLYNKATIDKRRETLCMWLKDNRVPFTITDDLGIEVLQAATIMPPYTVESVQCNNEVVLDKVIKLVTSTPNLEVTDL